MSETKEFKLQLSTEQEVKFNAWRDALIAKGHRGDSFGCFCMFTVVPSSMGYSVTVSLTNGKEKLDLTEYDKDDYY